MSVKKTIETTSQKILNSDIYDITRFVDTIKKEHIDGVDNKETLMVGMYGYMGYQFSSLLQNAIVTASELSNEAIPVRAKFDRNVITHALSLGVEKVAATAANMKVFLMFPEKALKANMIDGRFKLTADTPLMFDEFEFHTDYDITINYVELQDSTNGSQRKYVYTAEYDMTHKNPISDLENPYLPPVAIFNYEEDNMVVLSTNLHQVYYSKRYEKILTSDVISNKTISFSFEKQMSHFNVVAKEPSTDSNENGRTVYLNAVYDGLYNKEIAEQKYCYYQYINSNTIRIRFDPTNYQPPANTDIEIEIYTTDGSGGNFEYSEEKTIRLTSDKYTNLYCIVSQRGDDGSTGGLDRQSIEELQHIIPKEALSRGSITTLTDLRNFFNSLNNEDSVLHVFRKEDNILDRVYYVYNLMKDSEQNIVPTNTIPIYIESTRRDTDNGKIYLESGTPIFYYKFGDGTSLPLIKNNYIGYLQQKVSNTETKYSFYNDDNYTTYQGTPTIETLWKWYREYSDSFDPELEIEDFEYSTKKPPLSYDFINNGSICFKPYFSDRVKSYPSTKESYDNWFYGTCRSCSLRELSTSLPLLMNDKFYRGKDYVNDILDLEIEWKQESGSITYTTHFPKRNSESYPGMVYVYDENNNLIDDIYTVVNTDKTIDSRTTVLGSETQFNFITVKLKRTEISSGNYKYTISSIDLNDENNKFIKAIRFYRPRLFDSDNNVIGKSDYCLVEIPFHYYDEYNVNVQVDIFAWIVTLSFLDKTKTFSRHTTPSESGAVNRTFFVPDYITDLSSIDSNNKKMYSEIYMNNLLRPFIDGDESLLILEGINNIDVYSYDGTGKYGFNALTLAEGDLIRYMPYLAGENNKDFIYTDPSTWTLGEVLSIEKQDGVITSIEILTKNEELGEFKTYRYNIPVKLNNKSSSEIKLDPTYITLISKITKFLYTTPLSIILEDDASIDTHRITASYYLDIINETRYQMFDCINSKSPIQYILPSIKTYRSSYLSKNRYTYNIKVNIKPNTGTVDKNMINRTQVIGILYKRDSENTNYSKPIMYTIAKYTGGSDMERVNEVNGIPFEFDLYTRPFTTSTNEDDGNVTQIIDDRNDVYIGPQKLIKDLKEEYGDDATAEFFDRYRCFTPTANEKNCRPLEMDGLDIDHLSEFTGAGGGTAAVYSDTVYLNLNTEMKIYILYKYDNINPKSYTDGLTSEYVAVNSSKVDSLYNSVPQNTEFKPHIPALKSDGTPDTESPDYIPNYTLKQMVLTNVYDTYQGINLLYDYSNIMNSYVTSIKTNDLFNIEAGTIESYIINRVPCLRYFYWNNEDRVLKFIKEMKKKINYVLDAIDPLECTFGLDYKFFNAYGPSNMYHLTDDDGDATTELIDNVALTMTFRAKFYNEDSDSYSIIDRIKDSIKNYLEKLDQLDDIHFPNITTMIETEFREYLIYFEFVSFNIYDAVNQHIITEENMEMLSMVPEFLHVDTNDYTGLPYINVRVVTS